jgi:hypothetical protein
VHKGEIDVQLKEQHKQLVCAQLEVPPGKLKTNAKKELKSSLAQAQRSRSSDLEEGNFAARLSASEAKRSEAEVVAATLREELRAAQEFCDAESQKFVAERRRTEARAQDAERELSVGGGG